MAVSAGVPSLNDIGQNAASALFRRISGDAVQINFPEICQNIDDYKVDYGYNYYDFEKSFHGSS